MKCLIALVLPVALGGVLAGCSPAAVQLEGSNSSVAVPTEEIETVVSSKTSEVEPTEYGTEFAALSHGKLVSDLMSFFDAVTDALPGQTGWGEPNSEVEQPFMPVKGYAIWIKGEWVQVFEFADPETAAETAATLPEDGTNFETGTMTWDNEPHFYLKGKIIVLYLGSDEAILQLLMDMLGEQFAGGS